MLIGSISLKIDQNNREYIEDILFSEDFNSKGTLIEIIKQQGFEEWFLYLSYEDGREEELAFNDGEMNNLRIYIKENGYDYVKIGEAKISISIITIVLTVVYGIGYSIITKQ